MRIGIGYDIHPLITGGKLILGGVEIPYEMGLSGHSDADVAVHAIIDALLGAANLGDIGVLYPDTSPKYKQINSLILLQDSYKKVKEKGLKLGNLDLTILAEQPKLRPYIPQMVSKIAQTLEVLSEQISIKATTAEQLGFIGRKEGIATHAVVLLTTK